MINPALVGHLIPRTRKSTFSFFGLCKGMNMNSHAGSSTLFPGNCIFSRIRRCARNRGGEH